MKKGKMNKIDIPESSKGLKFEPPIEPTFKTDLGAEI